MIKTPQAQHFQSLKTDRMGTSDMTIYNLESRYFQLWSCRNLSPGTFQSLLSADCQPLVFSEWFPWQDEWVSSRYDSAVCWTKFSSHGLKKISLRVTLSRALKDDFSYCELKQDELKDCMWFQSVPRLELQMYFISLWPVWRTTFSPLLFKYFVYFASFLIKKEKK